MNAVSNTQLLHASKSPAVLPFHMLASSLRCQHLWCYIGMSGGAGDSLPTGCRSAKLTMLNVAVEQSFLHNLGTLLALPSL